jgi:hypothetical protein
MAMSDVRAKEIIISAMNRVAYTEFGTSLYTSDRNRLFGSEHFVPEPYTAPPDRPSPWQGEGSEEKLAEVLALASCFKDQEFDQAIKTLLAGDHDLNKLIRRAQRNQHWDGPQPFLHGKRVLALVVATLAIVYLLTRYL